MRNGQSGLRHQLITLHGQEEWNSLQFLMCASGWKIPGSELKARLKSLKKCGINNALDGSEDNILHAESDTSSENNHEDDFSGSDDDFLGFYDECITLWLLILVCNNAVFFQKITKIKIHSSLFFSKISKKKITVRLMGRCILWDGKYSKYLIRTSQRTWPNMKQLERHEAEKMATMSKWSNPSG